MKLKSILLTTGCALIVALSGCNKESAAETARQERAAALRTEARTAESQGNWAAAEALYRQLLIVDPTDAATHLSLANLSHDTRKHYFDAIYHYQRYLDLQPESDKTAMVNDRLASARSLLANQMAADIVAREQRSLTAERDALQAQLADQKKKVNELNKTIEKKDAQIEELQGEIARINRLLDKLKDIEAEARASREAEVEAARKLLEDAEAKRDAEETDETVAAIRAEADEILNSPDGGVQKQEDEANAEAEEADKPFVDEALRAKAEGAKDEVTITPIPTPGKRYCVRPGDTYSALAREAYGSAARWSAIRDANRSTTNPNGVLRAGEIIQIP